MKRIRSLIGALLVLVMLGSVVMPVMAKETKGTEKYKTKLGDIVISGNTAELTINNEKYRILVRQVGSDYLVRIQNSNGEDIWSGISKQNPIEQLKGVKISDIPIPPDANINIYPDKYTYRKDESGKVTIDVDNGGVSIGYTSYFILIPEGVSYNGVLDGPEPIGKINLTEDNSCYIVPEYGIVCGRGELLLWQAVHLSGYKKQIVLSVKYKNKGRFQFEAGTAVVDAIIGWGDASSDSFTVSVI